MAKGILQLNDDTVKNGETFSYGKYVCLFDGQAVQLINILAGHIIVQD